MRPPHCAGEIPAIRCWLSLTGCCFNEAPALRGGNPEIGELQPVVDHASMRPPHCAGEILDGAAGRVDEDAASMRPPHCAGEIWVGSDVRFVFVVASMRPPHCAGEIGDGAGGAGVDGIASMRPPHCAGEIASRPSTRSTAWWSFNEAPALRGGNRSTPVSVSTLPATLQ